MLSAELKWILRKFPPRSSTTKNGATQHVADPPSWCRKTTRIRLFKIPQTMSQPLLLWVYTHPVPYQVMGQG